MQKGDFINVIPGDGSNAIRMEIVDTSDSQYLLWDGELDWTVAKEHVASGEARARNLYLQPTRLEDL